MLSAIGNLAQQAHGGTAALRRSAQEVQADVQGKIAESEPGATVSYQYTIGPDGQLHISSATVIAVETEDANKTNNNQSNSFFAGPVGNSAVALSPSEELDVFGLTPEERAVVRDLQARDLEVRIHEAQHFRAAGGIASGGPQYIQVQGPDGRYYAVGGSVNIQSSATSDPAKQKRDSQAFINAALAPADLSAQDLASARSAISRAAEAYQNRFQNEQEEQNGDSENNIDFAA